MTDILRLIRDLRSVFGLRLAAIVVLMAAVGVTEGLSVVLLLPLLTRLGVAGSSSAVGIAGQALTEIDAWVGTSLWPLVAVIVFFVAASSSLYVLQSWLLASTSQRYAALWKERLLQSFFAARWSFFTKHKSGELLNAIVTEPGRLSAGAMNVLNLSASLIVSLVYISYAALLSWQSTALLLASSATLILAIKRLYAKTRAIGRSMGPLNIKQQVVVGEFLQSAKLIKAAAIEQVAVDRSVEVVRALEGVQRWGMFMPSMVRGIFEGSGVTLLVVLLVISNQLMGTTPANLLIVFALFVRLFPRITALQQYIHSINTLSPAVLFVQTLCEQARLAAEKDDVPASDARPIPNLMRRISIAGLVSEYDGRPVLDGVDLDIPLPGFVALLGPSGAGKSTLLSNILRLVPWSHGSIDVDGVPLEKLDLMQWRHSIGYMPQETMLFHTSIRENIALLKPDATTEEIETACQRAHLSDFILQSELGLDTIIGDQGIRLSGGQRQRIGLARALLCKPKLLLLDEATSAVDAATEREILEQLRDLAQEIGVLFVTHRESVAAYADRVYVLDAGRVSGQSYGQNRQPEWI